MSHQTILSENKQYWTFRASSYSDINKGELSTSQRRRWKNCLHKEISSHFPNKKPEQIRILDIGTGPGFFAIILCELGYQVTAIDLTPAMLEEAKKNAGELADRIQYLEMNAEALDLPDGCIDAVVSRNLTWNLPHPDKAYAEWIRVLKSGGLILNFDANWYSYLFDDDARAAYDRDRINSREMGVPDQNIGENFDVMEGIARRIPLSSLCRPAWDLHHLSSLGLSAEANETIWKHVWSPEEILNFSSTPMFMIRAAKLPDLSAS